MIAEILNQDYNKYTRKYLLDHNTEETIKNTRDGIMGGLSVYHIIKFSPKRAMEMIRRTGSDRIDKQ